MSGLISGSRNPAGAGRRIALRESTTFLSGLDNFCQLLDARQLHSPLAASATAAVLLNTRHFSLPRTLDRASSFKPVCGGTWGQGYEALLELASRATAWAESRGVDPHDEQLVKVWHEAIGLAWAAELTARCHLMPAPYIAWEAGMLLAAAVVGEQLRLLDADEEASGARLGQSAIRQVENLVIQYDYSPSLSLVSAVRRSSYLGPWPAVSLAYRLGQRQARFEWAEGVLDQVESLPTSPVVQACTVNQLRLRWPEYEELARRAWLAGIAISRSE